MLAQDGARVDCACLSVRSGEPCGVTPVLQDRYMGLMRHLKPRQKAEVRKIREAKGVRAAIARARRLS